MQIKEHAEYPQYLAPKTDGIGAVQLDTVHEDGTARYYRAAGNWFYRVTMRNGEYYGTFEGFLSEKETPLFPITRELWLGDNQGYAH